MANIEEINKESDKIGGDREVLTIKKVEENHFIVSPPYIEMSLPKSSVIGDIKYATKGDKIIVNIFPMTDGGPRKALRKKYYLQLQGEVL